MTRFLAFAMVFMCLPISSWGTEYYISSTLGNPGNEGTTPQSPLKSPDDLPRLADGDRIYFHRGDTIRKPVYLAPAHNNLILDAYGDGDSRPVICGSIEIENWQQTNNGIFKASVDTAIHRLFVNDVEVLHARHPNRGSYFYLQEKLTESTRIQVPELSQNKDYWKGALLHIRINDWTYDTVTVIGSDPGSITLSRPVSAKMGGNFYLDMHESSLDAPNEWYYDGNTKTVYIIPPKQVSITAAKTEATVHDYGIKAPWNTKSITVRNLHFINQNLDGVWLAGICESNKVLNCRFDRFGYRGVVLFGKNGLVENCVFMDGHNVAIWGQSVERLTVIRNNRVLRHAMIAGYSKAPMGFYLFNSSGMHVTGNRMDSLGHIGIAFPRLSHSLIEKNVVENVLLNYSDGGGIYTSLEESVYDTVRNNFVFNVHGSKNGKPGGIANGIYIDNYASNIIVENNTVSGAGAGIHVNGGANQITVRNNTLFNNRTAGLSFSDWKPEPIFGCVTESNIVVQTGNQASFPLSITSIKGGERFDVGTFNRNLYYNPFTPWVARRNKFTSFPLYTLESWQKTSGGEDLHSNAGPAHRPPYYNTSSELSEQFISNGDFSSNVDGWGFYGDGSISHDNGNELGNQGSLKLNFDKGSRGLAFAGSPGFTLKKDGFYRLSFTTRGSHLGMFRVVFKKFYGNYAPLPISKPVPLSTEVRNHELYFYYNLDEPSVQIIFQMEEESGSLWLDNVSLNKVSVDSMDTDSLFHFITNQNDNQKQFALTKGYRTLDWKPAGGSIDVPAYGSKVLVRDETLDNTIGLVPGQNFNPPLERAMDINIHHRAGKTLVQGVLGSFKMQRIRLVVTDKKGRIITGKNLFLQEGRKVAASFPTPGPGIYSLMFLTESGKKFTKLIAVQ